uniref:Rad60/SUMO-like domain-containing protein n=1 Tax=Felis catus TaxID=9685 RepID=A0ABI7XZB2_FELCA
MADKKPKEGVKTRSNDHINLKVAGQDDSVVQFKIKRHTPFSKLMKAYCERQGLNCVCAQAYCIFLTNWPIVCFY